MGRLSFTVAVALCCLASSAAPQGQEIGFAETFALADDRAAVLDELVPGSPDWSYHRCLVLQHEGRLDEVDGELLEWIGRHGDHDPRLDVIRNRQALLAYARDPARTYDHLRDVLRPRLDHQRDVPGAVPDLPTALDPIRVDLDALIEAELRRASPSLSGFSDRAWFELLSRELSPGRRRDLLDRVERPDHPQLVRHVLDDLAAKGSGGFGSLGVHRQLTLAQLEACLRERPSLSGSHAFVTAWVARLLPGPTVDWLAERETRLEVLDRLEAFARRIQPDHPSLLGHVLHQRLQLDRERGAVDHRRLHDFMELPRETPWRDLPDGLPDLRRFDTSATYGTGLPAVGDDEALVRACLTDVLRDADHWREFADVAHEEYLRGVFAEAKLLHGVGDPNDWAALLDDPARLEALRDRVEIAFAPGQDWDWAADAPVAFDVDVKNVATLLVKVFELDAFHVYSELERDLDLSLDLDGLVPNHERVIELNASPFVRQRRHVELPELAAPGDYVVEFVGNGIASRALVRKGRLRLLERVGSAGHVLHVLDDGGDVLDDAAVWVDGRQFEADAEGRVVVPFTTEPGRRHVVLRHGERATRTTLDHRAEDYGLDLAVLLDREVLLPGGQAALLLRPTLSVADEPIAIATLDEPVLTVTATDVDGVETTQQLPGLAWRDDAELEHVIAVPERLVNLTVRLSGQVESLSRGGQVEVSDAESFAFSAITRTDDVPAGMLRPTPDGWVLDVFGRAGEPVARRALRLHLRHRWFREPIDVSLRTDDAGQVHLGPLDGIDSVQLVSLDGSASEAFHTWDLPRDERSWPGRLAARQGDVVRVPWPRGAALERAEVSLLEHGRAGWVRDRFEHLRVVDGLLELHGLPVGHFDLWLRGPNAHVDVRVDAAEERAGWLVNDHWLVQQSVPPLHVTQLELDGDELVVRLAHAGADTRVHVQADRWLPAFDPRLSLSAPGSSERAPRWVGAPGGQWEQGRVLSDEQRYVLERRYAPRLPGNMLERPSLLLNPWALQESSSVVGVGGGASAGYGAKRAGSARAGGGGSGPRGALQTRSPARYADVSFLPEPARRLANLRPDADGVVRVPLADLGPGGWVQVVALDGEHSVSAELALPSRELRPREVRQRGALDPQRPVIEQRSVRFVDGGETVVLDHLAGARVELIDSLDAAWRLLRAVGDFDGELQRFAFLLEWPQLDAAAKGALYSEHASHELHLFLHEKDPAFFDAVVRPYLADKLHRDFVDAWLLDEDLAPWLDPWSYARLNVMERALLARRLPEHAAAVERELREAEALLPPDPYGERMRFAAALQGRGLEAEASLGAVLFEAGAALRSLGYTGGVDAGDDAFDSVFEMLPPSAPPAEADVSLVRASARGKAGRAFASDDLGLRDQVRAFHRAPDPTRLWVEQHYWKRRVMEGVPLRPHAFWADFAAAGPDAPFVSPHLAMASESVNEALLALALTDLPFEAGEHTHELDGARGSITAAGRLLLVSKALADAPRADDGTLLVSERVVAAREPDRVLDVELLSGQVHVWQVVVTNPTADATSVELLLQVPAGAMPLASTRATRGVELELPAFGTAQIETRFYFPRSGDFAHTPVRVAVDGSVVAQTEPRRRHVVDTPSEVDETSWEHVSQNGSEAQLWAWLDTANLRDVTWERMAWRMGDAAFFRRATDWLRERRVFDAALWSYGLLHEDARSVRELLPTEGGFVARCGPVLDSPLLRIEPERRGLYEHIEFAPLFNQRAHVLGDRRRLFDPGLAAQYASLLEVLAFTPALGDRQWFAVTYYLLLQDRVAEALETFAKVDRERLGMDLQHDYAAAWLAMSRADLDTAQALGERHAEHPVDRWRERFGELLLHVAEARGQPVGEHLGDGREARHADLLASEPSLELELDDQGLLLRHDNLETCDVRYTLMDVELLFSKRPFVQAGTEGFALMKPNLRQTVTLDGAAGQTRVPLPAAFAGRNVLVEVRGGGVVRRLAHTSSRLAVQVFDSFGQLKVTAADTGAPLPAVYVKVFARTESGAVRFHKDGYTDLRGRFDHASLSVDGLDAAERFAILVLSDEHGAVVREADVP